MQDTTVRQVHSDMYWLTVGADAVDEKIRTLQAQLYRQLTGKTINAEENDEAKPWRHVQRVLHGVCQVEAWHPHCIAGRWRRGR